MRNGEFVSLKQLDAAFGAVRTELDRLGLWQEGSRLQRTAVIWCNWPQFVAPAALGFCFDDPTPAPLRWLGYHAGNIYVPQWVLSHGPWGQERGSLRDVLRHEFGHALAWHHPALIRRSRRFMAAFSSRYDDPEPVAGPDAAFVSKYARTRPAEDFAETFMVYVQRNGRRPAWLQHTCLNRKWAYIRAVAQAIAQGHSRLEASP